MKITNISNTVSPYAPTGQIYVAPLEFRVTGIIETSVVTEINSNLAEQGCPNPLKLSTCDSGSNGVFDILWPDDTSNYTNDPGHNLANLIGGDNLFSPGESTTCNFMQFKFNTETEIHWYYDVLGKISGTGLAAPTVGAVTTPTKDLSPNITVTLSGVGDTVKITGGASTVTCADGDLACDLSGTAGTVIVDYSLKANQANLLQVFQQDSSPFQESSATVVNVTHDNTNPAITSISPANGAVNVSPASNILVTFDGNLEAGSVTTTNVLLNRDGGVGDCSTFGVAENRTLSQPVTNQILIDPNTSLQQSQLYCVRLVGLTGGCDGTNEIRDAATNCLAATQTKRFTTANSDNTAPKVLGSVPTDGANGISINSPIQIIFDEAMSTATVTSATNFTVMQGVSTIAGTRSLSGDGKTVTFTPTSNYSAGTVYTVTITTSVTDLAGNALATAFSFTFTTGSVADTTGPDIVSFLPADQASNVNENVSPQITFSEQMDATTINSANVHLEKKSDATPVPVSVTLSADGLTATLDPLSALAQSTLYLISVEYACKDIAGNNLASPQTAEFTTQSAADTTAPTVTQVTPADSSADVSSYTGVVVVFSEPVDANTVHTGSFYLEDTSQSPAVKVLSSVAVASDGLSATLSQSVPDLTKNNSYRVTVKSGTGSCVNCVKDVAGNIMSADFTSTFSTEFQDNYSATVIAVSPGNTVTSVPRNANVVLVYSEPILSSSVTDSNIYLTIPPSTTHVAGSLKLLADGISVRFTPSSTLNSSATYQVNSTSSVKDLSGRIATGFTSTFTTGTTSDSDGPTLSSSVPTDGATGVYRWPNITATFNETLDPSTANSANVELIRGLDSSKVAVLLSISSDSKTITVNPVKLLKNNESYYLSLKTGIRNISGFPLQSYTSVDFTTINNSSDVTAPYITNVVPINGATGVSRTAAIVITFSEAIDPDTAVNGIFSIQQAGGNPPPPKGDLTFSIDAATRKIVTMTPITALQNNTNYNIRVQNKVVDDADNANSCSASTAGAGCDSSPNTTTWISSFRT